MSRSSAAPAGQADKPPARAARPRAALARRSTASRTARARSQSSNATAPAARDAAGPRSCRPSCCSQRRRSTSSASRAARWPPRTAEAPPTTPPPAPTSRSSTPAYERSRPTRPRLLRQAPRPRRTPRSNCTQSPRAARGRDRAVRCRGGTRQHPPERRAGVRAERRCGRRCSTSFSPRSGHACTSGRIATSRGSTYPPFSGVEAPAVRGRSSRFCSSPSAA